jgi:glucosamine--fructose-6-phosphate aminotransferase (isomerizing)
MCGIVGISAQRDVVEHLISGLKALEYRGYDSAGIAVLTATGLDRRRAKGKVRDLEALQNQSPLSGHSGIAHTRWATHGVPNTRNAHPHISGDSLSVVHNGIIENHEELRAELRGLGYEFNSDTDTEVIAHLVEHHQRGGASLLDAARAALARMHGAYAVVLISGREPGVLVGARRGSPLVVGLGEGENYLASDIHALLPLTRRFIYLAEGDVAEIRCDSLRVFDEHGAAVDAAGQGIAFLRRRSGARRVPPLHAQGNPRAAASRSPTPSKAASRPAACCRRVFGVGAAELLAKAEGRAHRRLRYQLPRRTRRALLDRIAGAACPAPPRSRASTATAARWCAMARLFVTISQSGETADTLAALKLAQQRNYLARWRCATCPSPRWCANRTWC